MGIRLDLHPRPGCTASGDGSGVPVGIYLVEAGRCVAGTLQRTEQSTWYLSGNETEECSVFTTALSRPDGRRGSGS